MRTAIAMTERQDGAWVHVGNSTRMVSEDGVNFRPEPDGTTQMTEHSHDPFGDSFEAYYDHVEPDWLRKLGPPPRSILRALAGEAFTAGELACTEDREQQSAARAAGVVELAKVVREDRLARVRDWAERIRDLDVSDPVPDDEREAGYRNAAKDVLRIIDGGER